MAFLIEDIKTHKPKDGSKYLFDANVWLAVLDTNFEGRQMRPYIDLFDGVFSKKLAQATSIVMPSLLMSEIIYRYMNDIFYKEFCFKNSPPDGMEKHLHYKTVYRSSHQYKVDYANACSSIRGYNNNVKLLSDHLDEFTFGQLTKKIPVHLDFNDHMYVQFAKAQNLIIVTHDGDFAVEDVPIITGNTTLLKIMIP